MKPYFRNALQHYITSPTIGKPLIWQTKQQRDIYDLARQSGRSRNYATKIHERRYETENRQYGERCRSRSRKERSYPVHANSPGEYSRRKEDKFTREYHVSKRVRSLSRPRAVPVRGRSRSPRKPGEPGPSILKGRSRSALGGRIENLAAVSEWTWKAVRINRVDQVKYFRVSSDEESMPGVNAAGDTEISFNGGVDSEGHSFTGLNEQSCDDEVNLLNGGVNSEENCIMGLNENYCGNEETVRNGQVDSDESPTKKGQNHSEIGHNFESPHQLSDIQLMEDGNSNLQLAVRGHNHLNDAIFETQRNPNAISSGDDYSRHQIVCQKEDCPNTSLSSNLGLIPLSSKSGRAWLCSHHVKCSLCKRKVDNKNSVMCVSCARVLHTNHLPDQCFDTKFICMLCSDPEQFPPSMTSIPLQDCPLDLKQFDQSEDHSAPLFYDALKSNSCSLEKGLGSEVLEGLQIELEARLSNVAVRKKHFKKELEILSTFNKFRVMNRSYPLPSSGKKTKNVGDEDCSSSKKKQSLVPVKPLKTKSVPVLYVDETLPSGWSREIVDNGQQRKRVVIVGPNARRFWSRRDLEKYFLKNENLDSVQWQSFSFSLYGPK